MAGVAEGWLAQPLMSADAGAETMKAWEKLHGSCCWLWAYASLHTYAGAVELIPLVACAAAAGVASMWRRQVHARATCSVGNGIAGAANASIQVCK